MRLPIPKLLEISLDDAPASGAAEVHFTASFSEAVTGLSLQNFALQETGLDAALITAVDPVDGSNGTRFRVTVGVPTGEQGTLSLLFDGTGVINTHGIALADGSGGFEAPATRSTVELSEAGAAAGLAAADLDGDGDLDLVATDLLGGTVSVLRNDGHGNFTTGESHVLSHAPLMVTLADVNGDDLADIVLGSVLGENSKVGILINKGDGTFADETTFTVAGTQWNVAVADVNGDGRADIIVPDGNGHVAVHYADALGQFNDMDTTSISVGNPANTVMAVDLNNDGRADLVTLGSGSATLSVLPGAGNGGFDARQEITLPSPGRFVAAGDLNGDGYADLVVTGDTDAVSVLLNKGDGTFAAPASIAVAGSAYGNLALSDVNGDDRLDLVVTTTDGFKVLNGTGNGTFGTPASYGSEGIMDLVLADLDGDGKPDLAFTSGDGVVVADNIRPLVESDSYSLDRLAPTATATIDPIFNSTAQKLSFTVQFSEAVAELDRDAFRLDGTGTAHGSIVNVSASGNTYTVTAASVGGYGDLTLALSNPAAVTDAAGNAVEYTGATHAVAINSAPGGTVEISGDLLRGRELTASSLLGDVDGMGPVSFRWQRDDGAGHFSDIDGATGATYRLTQADVDTHLRAVASYTDGEGVAEQVASAGTATVALPLNHAPTGTVTVTGEAVAGGVLGATGSLADADGLGSFTFQWQREVAPGLFAAIAGATGESYTLMGDDIGHRMQLAIGYTDGEGFAETVRSAATATVAATVPQPDPAPQPDPTPQPDAPPVGEVVMLGELLRGSVLTAGNNLGDADGLGQIHYQWQRGDGEGGFSDIEGATAATYTLSAADVGHRLQLVASYTDGAGHAEAVSSEISDAVLPRTVVLAAPTDSVSHNESLSSADVASQLAAGDLLQPPAGTDTIQLADGTISYAAGSDAAYLARLYGAVLGRAGDDNGLGYWAHAANGGLDKLQVAAAFLDSPEYQAGHAGEMDAQFVDALYGNLLGREADAGGSDYFNGLLSAGTSRAQVLATVADSAEAQGHWSTITDAGIFVPGAQAGVIRAAYEAGLDRDAEAGGLSFHASWLAAGGTLTQLGDIIENSAEFQALHGAQNDHDFVADLYQHGLGRAGSEEEIGYYDDLLSSHAADRGDLVMVFATSVEAQAHLQWAL